MSNRLWKGGPMIINRTPAERQLAKRQAVEKKIVRRFVTDAIKAGYRLAVSLERGYDVEDMLLGSTDVKKIMEEAFAGDEAHIFIQPKEGPTLDEDGMVVSLGWVYIVLGNDGWDVISDWSSNRKGDSLTDRLLKDANALAERED